MNRIKTKIGLGVMITVLVIAVWLVNTGLPQRGQRLQQFIENTNSGKIHTVNIGEPLAVNDIQVVVELVDLLDKIEGFEDDMSGWRYLALTLRIKNQGEQQVSFSLAEFYLKPDKERRQVDILIDETNYYTKSNWFANGKKQETLELSPGKEMELKLVYNLAPHEEDLYLRIPDELKGNDINTQLRVLVYESTKS